MKQTLLILSLFISYFTFAQITHNATRITVSGTATGDQVRAYIVANNLGTVEDRTAIMGRSLNLATNASFTDSNATWIYPNSWHMDFKNTNPTLLDFEDVCIVYTGLAKGHTTQPRAQTLRLVNVQYRIESTAGRSDFFSNSDSGFEFSNVQFQAYNQNSFLHLPTSGGLLENVSVVAVNMNAFQPDCNPGQTLLMRNWTLDQRINKIIPNGGGNLTAVTRLENLTWPRTVWEINGVNRGQTYVVVNPNKPAGWIKYTGQKNATNDTYEVHTHNVKIVDKNNIGISNFKIQLRRNDATTLVYDLVTDSNGDIAEQEVVTYEQTSSNVWQQNTNFIFSGIDYHHSLVSGVKDLQNRRIDEVIFSQTDNLITESSKATVDAYTGIAIDHTAKTITISQNRNLCELYDFAKANKVDNIQFPTPTTLTLQAQENTLNLSDYQLVITGTAILSPCDKFQKVESTVNGSFTNVSDNLGVSLTDPSGTYKLISLEGVVNGNIVIKDESTSPVTILKSETNFTGDFHTVLENNSTNISVVVSRVNFSNWAADIDMTTADVFNFIVVQSATVGNATIENQELLIFYARKILQKNQAVLSTMRNESTVNLTVNTINQSSTVATEEKQKDLIALLKRILSKSSTIREVIKN